MNPEQAEQFGEQETDAGGNFAASQGSRQAFVAARRAAEARGPGKVASDDLSLRQQSQSLAPLRSTDNDAADVYSIRATPPHPSAASAVVCSEGAGVRALACARDSGYRPPKIYTSGCAGW